MRRFAVIFFALLVITGSANASTRTRVRTCARTAPQLMVCGDGRAAPSEECDDRTIAGGDGCLDCLVEAGYQCAGWPSVCATTCGDGVPAGLEGCDDSNVIAADGCTEACAVEAGYQCSGTPSACTTTCGDSVQAGAEECDDGNTSNGDGCSATCTTETMTLVYLSLNETTYPFTNTGLLGGTYTTGGSAAVIANQPGKFSRAVENPTGYALTSGTSFYPTASGSFSVGGWLNPTGTQIKYAKAFLVGDPNNSETSFHMYFDDLGVNYWKARISFTDGHCYLDAGPSHLLTAGIWHNVQFNYDATGRVFSAWLNGVQVATTTCTQTGVPVVYASNKFQIGSAVYGQSFVGYYDEVYAYNGIYVPACGDGIITYGEECDDSNLTGDDGCSAICVVEVPAASVIDANTIAFWALDESTGTALDSAGSYDVLAFSSQPGSVVGKLGGGRSMSTDLGNYYFTSADSTGLWHTFVTDAWTIEGFIKPELDLATGTILENGGDGETLAANSTILLNLSSGKLSAFWEYGTGANVSIATSTNVIPSGAWHHFAVRKSRSGATWLVEYFIDGVASGVSAASANTATDGTLIFNNIGAKKSGGGGSYLRASLDSIRVSNIARTNAEILGYSALVPGCGNGNMESGEACDDGNLAAGDGCSSLCAIE